MLLVMILSISGNVARFIFETYGKSKLLAVSYYWVCMADINHSKVVETMERSTMWKGVN